MTVKVAGVISIYVEGLEMRCPFCQTLVSSGQEHRCKISSDFPNAKLVKKTRGAIPPGDPSGC